MTVARSYSTLCVCDAYATELVAENAWNDQYQLFEKVKVVTNLNLGNVQHEERLDLLVWSPDFIKMIALADDDIANGRVKTYHSAQDLIDDLNAE